MSLESFSENKFSWDEYKKERCIGKGGFGTVFLCKNDKFNCCVVKEIHVDSASENEISTVLKEARILSSLTHPNIISYLDHGAVNKTLYIVMEYAPGGDLDKFIAAKVSPLPESDVTEMLCEVLCGLAYLHSREVLHRDVCARNVLLARGGTLKLADFGMSRRIESLSSGGPVGNPGNFAPELCWGGKASKSSDMWAVGCLLHHMACGRPPFSSPSLAGTVRLITSAAPAPSLPPGYGAGLRGLLAELLARTPAGRPSAEALLARPCLATAVHSGVARYRPLAPPERILDTLGFGHLL